jgi:predicted nucleotidyltransferase component of viral defense system
MAGEGIAPLRPLRVRMAAGARTAGKPQFVLEKDYALGYLLAGIAAVPSLRESLVFKGGTCLRKSYFPGYRFSEDLDFTSRTPWDCEALLEELKHAVRHMEIQLARFGPFQVAIVQERHRGPHPRGQCSFRVRVQFPWMRSADCSLKIEVAAQEPLLTEPVERRVLHEFPGESVEAFILAYSLEEVAAEKLRALLQSRQHVEDHGWVRNRPRDLYDLWHLQRDVPIDWYKVRSILPVKARAYDVTYKGPEDFLDKQVLEGIQRDWEGAIEELRR